MPHGIDGVKVREQVSTKCLSSGVPGIFYRCRIFGAGAGFRYQPEMSTRNGRSARRGCFLGGAGTARSLSDLSSSREYVIYYFQYTPIVEVQSGTYGSYIQHTRTHSVWYVAIIHKVKEGSTFPPLW